MAIAAVDTPTVPPVSSTPPPADTPVTPLPADPGQFNSGLPHGFFSTSLETASRGTRHSADTTGFLADKATDPRISVPLVGIGGAVATRSAIKELQRARAPLSFGNVASGSLGQMGTNAMRITPTLVSAIAGPALADAASYVAPNLVPKYKPVTSSNPRAAGEGVSSDKGQVQFLRAAVGGAGIGALAGLVFLVKPSLFQKAGFISEKARTGIDAVTGLKTGTAMSKNAVFSHRLSLGIVGGGAAAYLGQRALGEDGDTQRNLLIGAGATALGTAAAIKGMPAITRGSESASKLAFMPDKALFWKPNLQWFKEYGSKIAPITAIPAGSAAYTYLDTFNDFGKITDSRSQYRN